MACPRSQIPCWHWEPVLAKPWFFQLFSLCATVIAQHNMKNKKNLANQENNMILSSFWILSILTRGKSVFLEIYSAHPFSYAMWICSLSSSSPHSRSHYWWMCSSRNSSRHGLPMINLQNGSISAREKKKVVDQQFSPKHSQKQKIY